MKRIAVCSGSFDPVTVGHVDIFERASGLFDELVICVFHNVRKQSFLPLETRRSCLEAATRHIQNVRVDTFSGLIPAYMAKIGAKILVRGVRSVKDLEYERNEADILRHLAPELETVFLLTDPKYSFVSSSAVREILSFGGDASSLVPESVWQLIKKSMKHEA